MIESLGYLVVRVGAQPVRHLNDGGARYRIEYPAAITVPDEQLAQIRARAHDHAVAVFSRRIARQEGIADTIQSRCLARLPAERETLRRRTAPESFRQTAHGVRGLHVRRVRALAKSIQELAHDVPPSRGESLPSRTGQPDVFIGQLASWRAVARSQGPKPVQTVMAMPPASAPSKRHRKTFCVSMQGVGTSP
jgi:hypothetical protein